ncbi:MAG: hypothetical protein IJS37_01765 [Bacilli bacterium]|nr:hypothetical protein [Bacilli bacterium]
MKMIVLLEGWHIGLIVGGGILLLIALIILLNFTLLASIRYKRQVRELSRRFEYLHALLIGQDSQYLRRIEAVSASNLLYVDTHASFSKRFKDIRDNADSSAQTTINGLKDNLSERNYAALKLALPRARQAIDAYEEEVNSLNNDLTNVVKPEEECKQLSLQLKEELRKIKQDYFIKQSDLSLVTASFDEVFTLLDKKFQQFDGLVESAHYDDAKALLPDIEAVIRELGKSLQVLPNICISITTVIPDKMSSLQNRYDEMIRADFPLHHLIVKGNIQDMNTMLDEIIAQVKVFDFRGVEEKLDGIIARIDEYFDLFDKEKEARLVFENECDSVYSFAALVDRKNIRLSNSLADVKKIFVISSDAQSSIDSIGVLINKAGATKRSLDTFVHSGTKQPFSILVEKMNALRDEAEQASNAIDDFDRYLHSLKDDTESAVNEAQIFYAKLHQCEVSLDKMGLPVLEEKYRPTIERCYDLIDIIFDTANTLPIDVSKVNQDVLELHDLGTALVEGLMSDYDACRKAEGAIVYANRERRRFGEVNDILKQAETLYFSGEFARVSDETTACLRRLRGE